jgi:hypothetical protein
MTDVKVDCPMCSATFSGPTEEDAKRQLMEHGKVHEKK